MSVTQEQIFAICDQMFAEGQKVTNESVRKQLGRGSFSTISKTIQEWKKSIQMGILQEFPQPDIPKEAMPHLQRMYAVAQSYAQEAEITEQVKLLEAENENLRCRLDKLEGADERLSRIHHFYQEAQKRLEELERENEHLKQGIRPEEAPIVEELRQQIMRKQEKMAILQQMATNYHRQIQEHEPVLQQLSHLKSENERLEKENDDQRDILRQYCSLIEEIEMDKGDVQVELRAAQKEIASLKEANRTLERELYLASHSNGTAQKTDSSKAEQICLSAAALAKRLEVSPSTIKRRAANDDFTIWSRKKDPDNKGWIKKNGKFVPES